MGPFLHDVFAKLRCTPIDRTRLIAKQAPCTSTDFVVILDRIQIRDRLMAQILCQLIPASCPFARDISLVGHTLHIPPLCQLNPFYDELMALRFRALTFLAENPNDTQNFC